MADRIYKICLSAGHGVYFNRSYKQCMTQHRNHWAVSRRFLDSPGCKRIIRIIG